ncbi:MAG: DUF2431 domain-containing protein, partial [Bacteroidia bacterium]|nr:DUF2431 domain-containing protein [Bacteroidia bacterium]
ASVALQMVGISYQNIRKHLVKIIPEPVVEGMEKGFEIVKALITEGPMAAWEQLQEMAGEMKEAFVDAVKNWIKETIIVKAIEFIASLIIPGAGIIRAIVGIYDTIVFFIQKAKDIAQMVGNFLGSIGEIAMGNIGAAANALENGLATALTLVISFLAKLIHLDGVTAKIRAALNKIRGKVENMMAKVAKWIADKAKKLWGKMTGKDKKEAKQAESIAAMPPEEKVKAATQEAKKQIGKYSGKKSHASDIQTILQQIKTNYQLRHIKLMKEQSGWSVDAEINPKHKETFNPSGELQIEELMPGEGKKVLLLGEGNFSFALNMAAKTKDKDEAKRVVATSYITEQLVHQTYPKSGEKNINKAKTEGLSVHHGVDARNISKDLGPFPGPFEKIIFNFPFVPVSRPEQTEVNRKLTSDFFQSASEAAELNGLVFFTQKEYWLKRFQARNAASSNGFSSYGERTFNPGNFPGYEHMESHAEASAELKNPITLIYQKT